MKTKLLKLVLCALTLLPLSAWADINFGTEEVVNTTTTWTFNDYSDGDMKSYSQTNKLYLRAISSRYYSISSISSQILVFSDNYQVTVSKVATSNAAGSMGTSDKDKKITTANSRPDNTNNGTAFFAFNASVPGTVYVLMQAVTGSSYRPRIYFYKDGDSYANSVVNPTDINHTNIHELTHTSTEAGSFFIGTTNETCKIYAIRFVPTQYTISYAANGGTGTMSSNTVIKGNNQTLTANAFTKDGYTFANWTADVNVTIGGETVTAGSAIANSATIQNVTSDIALTAQWSANSYTVTLDNQSATSAGTTSVPVTYAANTELTSNITCPTKTGYTFGGYFTETAGGGSQLVDSDGAWIASVEGYTDASTNWIHSDNVTLYAKWTVNTYTVKPNLTGATKTSGETTASYNSNYTAVFKANDDYILPSAITVTAGETDITANCTWTRATGTVSIPGASITGNLDITVTATKAAVVTKWNFEEYMPGHNLFGSSTSRDAMEFTDGLYLHTRDADSENHWIKAATATIASGMDDNIISQTKTYSRRSTYPAIAIMSGNLIVSDTDAAANVDCNGISYKAPADGTFYYTVYTESANAHVYSYKNQTSSPTDHSINPGSKGGAGGEFSISVEKDDIIYITTSAKPMYLLEAMFVPTDLESTHTTVTFKSAGGGYASFSSTKNYTVPTGVTAYYVSSVDDKKNEAVMKTIGSVIPACTGVILYKDGVTTEDVAVEMTTAGKTNAVDNHLRANIVAYDLPADDGTNFNYTLAAGRVFKHSSGSGTLAAGKAFLRTTVNVPGGGEARGFNLVFDEDETTAVADVRTKKEDVSGDYYDLSGRKVVQPTRGLYIVNGKKVFIK